MIVADPWLVDLAVESAHARAVAALLLRCQVRTFRRTGHVLDYGESVRGRIRRAALRGNVALTVVRCVRCDKAAKLSDWVELDRAVCENWALSLHGTRRVFSRRYGWDGAAECRGDWLALGMAGILAGSLPAGVGE